jgi:hypothetical protein
MANVSNLATAKILRAVPLRVYINPLIAADGSVALVSGGLDAAVHTTAKDLGYTQGGLQFSRAPTFEDLAVDQSNEPVLLSMSGVGSSVKFKGLQVRDYAIWQKIVPASAVQTATGLTGIGDQTDQTITPFSLVAIAPAPNDNTKYIYLIVYAGYNVAPFNVNFAKAYNVTDIEMKIMDAGRSDGGTWKIFETTA